MESRPIFLLIEDNLIDQFIIRKLLKKVLEIDNISIANNGKEGIQWLNSHQHISSLIILLDIQMPVMNGFEFLREYDKLDLKVKKETQIYVLSSTLDADEIKKIKNINNVTEFLNKPLPIEEFRKICLSSA